MKVMVIHMNNEYITAIKDNQVFRSTFDIKISYKFDAEEFAALDAIYNISNIAGTGSLNKALNLLAWVNRNIHHTGNYDNSDRQDALTLLEAAFDKDYGINCLSMAIILCECLLAVKVPARVMYMMPQSAQDGDNHVVVEAFIAELGKWVMLDPTYGSYCIGDNGTILNLYEIRTYIASDKDYSFSHTLNYNGSAVDDIDDVKEYYAKDLFFLRCKSVQGYGQHVDYGNIAEISPVGFDVHKRMVDNLQFRIESYGDCELFARWKKYEECLINEYIDIDSIY